tara:strand:+ start:1953 stop:2543 length:591 start_codon:yes stop_codon:yes gene_type:complete
LRRFAIIGHRAPSVGSFNLNDLSGSGGRMDVLARAINAALFISHGIREDTEIIVHLNGDLGFSRRVKFDGRILKGVHPDERSISGHIRSIIGKEMPPIGIYEVISEGISHSGGRLEDTLKEWKEMDLEILILDSGGESNKEWIKDDGLAFVISDDLNFTKEENEILEVYKKISLGSNELQGQACISIIHYILDNQM